MANTRKKTDKMTLQSLTIYSYQVGFGDCFLLTFNYSNSEKRNVLIDFGSTKRPKGLKEKEITLKSLMLKVAKDIKEKCKVSPNGRSKLHVVIASHRHKDHIGGFSTEKRRGETHKTSGEIIRDLKPDLVIQPWTEDPNIKDEELESQLEDIKRKQKDKNDTHTKLKANSKELHSLTLKNMQEVAGFIKIEAERLGRNEKTGCDEKKGKFIHQIDKAMQDQLVFMGENNLPNESAVRNLRNMGKPKRDGTKVGYYVKCRDKIDFQNVVPGVKLNVLGPPDLEQHHEIMEQRSRDENEFWMLQSMLQEFWGKQANTFRLTESFIDNDKENDVRLFPKAKVYQNYAPSHTRWFIRQVREVRAEQLLGLVRILDRAMNNTSLILLFEAGEKKLLFPGDAQIENWEYALDRKINPDFIELLSETDVYKVGHHGSRNATPKTLWKAFKKKATESEKKERLMTLMSTLSGTHGKSEATAVPRKTLVDELEENSEHFSTEEIEVDEKLEKLFKKTEIVLTSEAN